MNSRYSLNSIEVLLRCENAYFSGGFCGHSESADNAATRELNLEAVFAGRASVFQGSLCGFHEVGAVGSTAFEGFFSFEGAPGFGTYASERDAYVLYLPARHLHNDGGRGERKLVGCAIAQLQIC